MNVKKLLTIILIWIVVAGGWVFLAGTIKSRTAMVDDRLTEDVAKLWGVPQAQAEPTCGPQPVASGPARPEESVARQPADKAKAAESAAPVYQTRPDKSAVEVAIDSESRQRGLLWFPVYHVRFSGQYTVTNHSPNPEAFVVTFTLPQSAAEFSGQEVTVDGQALPAWTPGVRTPELAPGQSCVVGFTYASKGTSTWRYTLPRNETTRDLTLTMKVNTPDYDFAADDPESSPPDERQMKPDADGRYTLTWHKKLVSNANDIVVKMPQRAQPGPLTERICRLAPVSLFFFFVIMVTIQVVRKLTLHPMHYLFLAAAFFAFHLLMAYLVDHVDVHGSFWIAAAASVFLVVMYLWLVAGPRVAVLYAGVAQLIYLVLFSYSFFLEGFTGLTVTIGAVVTLAVLMVMTAKVRWGESMPELERRQAAGWVPIQPAAGAPPVAPGGSQNQGPNGGPPGR